MAEVPTMADRCPCSGWRPAYHIYLDSDQLSVLEELHYKENVIEAADCRQLGSSEQWEWRTLLPLRVVSQPQSCRNKALAVLQKSKLEWKDAIIKNLLMLVELREMGILNHEEIEEMKKMERHLEDRLPVILCSKDSDVITKSAEVVTKHGYTDLGKVLLVMAKLKGLEYFSVEEAIAVWKDYREWEANLVPVAATKDSNTVNSIASVMDTHWYSEECKVLKVMAKLKASNCLSVEEAIAVWKDYRGWGAKLVPVDYRRWEANLVSVAATKDSRTVKSIASVMNTHGYSEECRVLKVSSEAYQLVRKSEHWKEDGRMRTVLALYSTLLCSEDDRVLEESERMTNDTLVNKLQVVGSLVMRMLEDPLYQNIEPNLSALKGRQWTDWYRDLNDFIAGLLKPFNAGSPGVVDKLRVLILCYWSGLISDEECERVSSLGDPEWRSQLEALQNEDINDVLDGRWWEYYSRQRYKHRVQLLFTEEFQSKLMEAAIDKGGSVEVEIVKVVTLGPPEAGKTQLKKALTKNVDETKESTPVSTEAEVVIDCFVEEGSNTAWKKLDGRELQTMLCATIEKGKYDVSLPNAAQKDTSHWKGQIPMPIIREKPDNAEHLLETGQMSLDEEVVYSSSSRLNVWGSEESDGYTDFEIASDSKEEITSDPPVMSTFSMLKERVVRLFPLVFGDNHLNKVRLIHMIDSGGQPAFLDFHPLVATSRALYLVVYNSQEGLLARPALTYRKPTEFPTKSLPNPSQTNLDMIKRSLHSLHHCKDKLLEMEATMRDRLGENVTIDPSNVLPIIVVGSRKAQQCQEVPSNLLKSHCCSIPIWDDTQPNVVLVDSLNPSCSGVEELRETISKTESKFKIRFPLLWFHCQLMFWSTDDPSLSVLTYPHLQEICMKHKLVSSGKEFLALITTFHMLGLFVCSGIDRIREDSSDSDSLYNSPIFTKPDVLYQQISKILEIPFRDLESPKCNLTPAQRKSFKDIQREGIISAASLHLLGVPDTLGSFPGFHTYLLQSLVKWGLAAQVSQDPLQLFIPSVLPTRSDAHCTLSESPIPQLAFTIIAEKSDKALTTISEDSDDYYHLPQGLFPHFIVSLMKRKDGGYELRKGRGKAQPRCRDVITLTKYACQETDFSYNICAVDNIDHISVHIIPVLEDESSLQWSPKNVVIIIEDLKQSMKEAYSRLYQRSTQPQVILCCPCSLCPLAQQKKHLARVDCERLTLHCLSLERDREYAKKCSGTMEAILKEMKRTQRKTEPVKLPSSPSKQDSCPPSEGDDVQPSHPTSSKSPEHQNPVLSTPKVTQRKREPHKLPTSASKKTDNKTSLKDKPPQKDLNTISNNAGGNWRSLLTELGLEDASIEEFRQSCFGSTSEACFKGLVHWLSGNADKPATWEKLLKALRNSNMVGFADDLEEQLRSPPSEEDNVQSSHPTSAKSPEHQHPVLSTPKVLDSVEDVSSLRSLVLGGLCTVNITCKGGKFPLHPFGLTDEDCSGALSAPEGVVAKGVTVAVQYAVLLSGPFRLPENWQRVSVVLYLNCPKSSWLLKPIELRLRHWAVLAEGTIISAMKAPHILLPNEKEFVFEEVQHRRVFSDVVSLSMQEDFCLICSAAKPSGPREVGIKCFGMLIPTPMKDRVQNLYLCCTFADTAWISAMDKHYRFIESGKRCPKPSEFIFTGNAIEAQVREVKGPGWTVTVVKGKVSKEELSSIDECTQCDKKIARMAVGLYPPSMDFVVTYEKTPSEKTHHQLANIVELVPATSRDQAASFCFHVHSRMDPTVTQRKREPHKLPTSASKKTDNKTSLKDKPLKKDANMASKEAGGTRSPPSEEDDVQPSHPTSSMSPEHQHPVLSTPKDFMEHFHKEFFAKGVVKGQMILDKLADEEVIPKALKNKLAKEDDEYKVASAIFNHMKEQGDYESLEALCTIMKNEGGMKQMNKLGKKMLDCLVANKDNFSE